MSWSDKNDHPMNHIERQAYKDELYQQVGVLGAWNALLDAHNAVLYGFVQYRLPEPGKSINVLEAEAHVARIEREWESEGQRRDPYRHWAGAPSFSTMPLNAKLYLHSVLLDGGLDKSGSHVRNHQLESRTNIDFRTRVLRSMGRRTG
jgi:hypothetical protein